MDEAGSVHAMARIGPLRHQGLELVEDFIVVDTHIKSTSNELPINVQEVLLNGLLRKFDTKVGAQDVVTKVIKKIRLAQKGES